MGNLQDRDDIVGLDADEIDVMDAEIRASGSETLKIEEGETRLRVLPGLKGESPIKIFFKHIVDDPEDPEKGPKISAICPRMMSKGRERCAFCDFATALKNSGIATNVKRAERFEPRVMIACNVVVRGQEDMGVKVWEFGRMVWKALKKIAKSSNGGDYTNPNEDGFDLIIDREGSGKTDTKYTVTPSRDACPLHEDEEAMALLLDGRKSLVAWTTAPDSEEVKRIAAPALDPDLISNALSAGPARRPLAAGNAMGKTSAASRMPVRPGARAGDVIDVSPVKPRVTPTAATKPAAGRGPLKRAQDKLQPVDEDDDVPL